MMARREMVEIDDYFARVIQIKPINKEEPNIEEKKQTLLSGLLQILAKRQLSDQQSVPLIDSNGEIREEQKRVLLYNLLQTLVERQMKTQPISTPILPIGSRGYFRISNREVLVLEQPPQIRNIVSTDEEHYSLFFPYVVYVFYLENGYMPNYKSRVFFRNAPLTSLDDKLLLFTFSHANVDKNHSGRVSGTGAVCMDADHESTDPLELKIIKNLEYYWHSRFSLKSDRNGFFWGLKKVFEVAPQFNSLEDWQKASQEDPLSILRIPWPETGLTVRQVIDEALGQSADQIDKPKILTAGNLIDIIEQLEEI